jgi:endonuclease IV
MNDFNRLVNEQMETMEKLLFLQGELERCKEIERELLCLSEGTKLKSIQEDIANMKSELKKIHEIFEQQTEELIRTYQDVNAII